MRYVVQAAIAALLLLTVAPAQAQYAGSIRPGLYVQGAAGPTLPEDTGIDGSGIETSADLDVGFFGHGAVGYQFENGIRLELEIGYRQANVDGLAGVTDGSGDIRGVNFMGNVLYELDTGYRATPYVGAGVGLEHADFDDVEPVGGSRIDDSDTVFAYQSIVGVGYRLTESLQLFTDYRFFATSDFDLSTDAGTSVDANHNSHVVQIGLRWTFGAPPKPTPEPEIAAPPPPEVAEAPPPPSPPEVTAPPPPEPAPPMPTLYLVFFEWDRSDLTPEARRVIRTAAENAEAGGVSRIESMGHADRSGPDAYNMGLSKRRAESVRAELIRLGIPEDEIAIFWKGEREPLVETPDGVREAQNRRVEIVFK